MSYTELVQTVTQVIAFRSGNSGDASYGAALKVERILQLPNEGVLQVKCKDRDAQRDVVAQVRDGLFLIRLFSNSGVTHSGEDI